MSVMSRISGTYRPAVLAMILVLCLGGVSLARDAITSGPGSQEPAATQADTGDTAWVLISAALVMLMTPGLAFFYGGLVRRKNMLSVLMQCFMILCLISLQWVLCGYSLAFGPDVGGRGIIGGLDWLGCDGFSACDGAGPAARHGQLGMGVPPDRNGGRAGHPRLEKRSQPAR